MSKQRYLADRAAELDDTQLVELLDNLTDRVAQADNPEKSDIIHITQIKDAIVDTYENWGKVSGMSTGYPLLDKRIGGLTAGHLILIGGETSNGKSAFAANIARNVAKRGDGVLYITLEMLHEEIGSRFYHINGKEVDDLNIMFQQQFQLDYKDIEPLLIKATRDFEVKLVVLDYMQYLGRGMTNEEVSKMSKTLKTLALKYGIPFVVIVSLRKGDGKFKRKWTEIEIDDLMGTGSIGYDCDVAMIASRKNMDNEFENESFFIKLLKTRNVDLDFNNRYIKMGWDKTRVFEYDEEPIFDRIQQIFG